MSYKTNTIANRLKITKGWKNSLFPTKKWNYSHETVLWFKLYLFLKAYLFFKRIQLLSCEMRMSEKKIRILYLSINKIKKRKKKYVRKALILKKLKSSLNRRRSKKAKYLLYSQKLLWLKQISFWKYNNTRQKLLSKLWISKPRLSSWINLVHIIQTQRQSIQIYQKIKQQKFFFSANIWRAFSFLKQKKNCEKKLKSLFLEVKQKKLFNLFVRLQKNIYFLREYLFSLKLKRSIFSTHNQKNLDVIFFSLSKLLKKQMLLAKQIYSLYLTVYQQNFILTPLNNVAVIQKQMLKKQMKQKGQRVWKRIQKQIKFFVIKTFIKTISDKKPLNLMHLHSVFYPSTLSYNFLMLGQNYFWNFILEWYNLTLSKMDTLNTQLNLLNKYEKFFSRETFQTLSLLVNKKKEENAIIIPSAMNFLPRPNNKDKEKKIFISFLKEHLNKKNSKFHKRIGRLFLKSKLLPKKLFAFQAIRLEQKLNSQNISFPEKKQVFNYRLPYRQYYIQNLKFSTNFKLKYWLQSVIQQYFAIKFRVKFLWPLTQLKNIKFYRLVFPPKTFKKKKRKKREEIKTSILKKYKENFSINNYVYLAKTTNHLTTNLTGKKIFLPPKKEYALKFNEKNLIKKRPYFSEKWLQAQNKKKSRLFPFSNLPFIRNLIPTLLLFVKYLDPQLLANELAKIIEKSKHQKWFLYNIRQIFRSLFIKNIGGYKIVLIGRVNGRKKTRLVSIKSAKESNTQQTILKQVSFGSAQARGRIGTFGIKIWLYH